MYICIYVYRKSETKKEREEELEREGEREREKERECKRHTEREIASLRVCGCDSVCVKGVCE